MCFEGDGLEQRVCICVCGTHMTFHRKGWGQRVLSVCVSVCVWHTHEFPKIRGGGTVCTCVCVCVCVSVELAKSFKRGVWGNVCVCVCVCVCVFVKLSFCAELTEVPDEGRNMREHVCMYVCMCVWISPNGG
jgi:hypothetical protein